jgi:two-component system, cell cycle sensor histidine kinase and response regulator CckA
MSSDAAQNDVPAAQGSLAVPSLPVGVWLDTLFETSPVGICLISATENRCVRVNAALARLYGLPVEEILSRDPFSLALQITHPEDLVQEQALFGELAAGKRSSYQIEKRYVQPDGCVRWGFLTFSWIFANPLEAATPVEALRFVLVQVVDITERKLLEEKLARVERELQHAQKVDGIGRLAAGVAHDFNNLLTVIIGHAEVSKFRLREDFRALPTEDFDSDLTAILDAAEHATSLTRQLLAYGRRAPVAPREFALSTEVAALSRLMTRTLGPDVSLELALEATGLVFADAGQIGQVVMNLVLNARDALPVGGRIGLVTRDVFVAEDTTDPEQPGPGHWLALVVSDTGHGMSPDVQARMFEPFFTTRGDRPGTRGTGLGLSTVQQIVGEAGGVIRVKSAPGQGTSVTGYFPRSASREAMVEARQAAPRLPTRATRHRVLVVEDEAAVRFLMGTVLMGAQYWVRAARDATEALSFIDAEREPFDLIVSDLLMPGEGGIDLAKRLQARGQLPRMLFISGYSDRAQAELVAYGPLLPKPFTPTRLLEAVAAALGIATLPHETETARVFPAAR